MNPYTGETYRLREELMEAVPPGEMLDMAKFEQQMKSLPDPTPDEIAAVKAQALVAITETAAQKLKLGEREIERRKRRRKIAAESRKRNR